jgi:hypothetical protein
MGFLVASPDVECSLLTLALLCRSAVKLKETVESFLFEIEIGNPKLIRTQPNALYLVVDLLVAMAQR